MKRIICIFLLILGLFSISPIWGQHLLQLSGVVHDGTGASGTLDWYPYELQLWDMQGTTLLGRSQNQLSPGGNLYYETWGIGITPPCKGRVILRDCRGAVNYYDFDVPHFGTVRNGLDMWICPEIIPVKATFLTEPVLGNPLSYSFRDYSLVPTEDPVVQHDWTLGDGTTAQGAQTPIHTYPIAANYNVCHTMLTQSGRSYSFCDMIAIGSPTPNPTVNLNWVPLSPANMGFVVTTTHTSEVARYTYQIGYNVFDHSSDTVLFNFLTAGTDSARVRVFFTDGSFAFAGINLTHPGKDFGARFAQIQDTTQQYSLLLQDLSYGNIDYHFWDFGDGDTSNLQYPTHTFPGPGTYVISHTVLDLPTSCLATYSDSVVVMNKVNSPFTIQVVPQGPVSAASPNTDAPQIALYPNPANTELELGLHLTRTTHVSLDILDLQGRVMLRQDWGIRGAGEQQLEVDVQALPAGLYMARIQQGEQQVVKRLVIAR